MSGTSSPDVILRARLGPYPSARRQRAALGSTVRIYVDVVDALTGQLVPGASGLSGMYWLPSFTDPVAPGQPAVVWEDTPGTLAMDVPVDEFGTYTALVGIQEPSAEAIEPFRFDAPGDGGPILTREEWMSLYGAGAAAGASAAIAEARVAVPAIAVPLAEQAALDITAPLVAETKEARDQAIEAKGEAGDSALLSQQRATEANLARQAAEAAAAAVVDTVANPAIRIPTVAQLLEYLPTPQVGDRVEVYADPAYPLTANPDGSNRNGFWRWDGSALVFEGLSANAIRAVVQDVVNTLMLAPNGLLDSPDLLLAQRDAVGRLLMAVKPDATMMAKLGIEIGQGLRLDYLPSEQGTITRLRLGDADGRLPIGGAVVDATYQTVEGDISATVDAAGRMLGYHDRAGVQWAKYGLDAEGISVTHGPGPRTKIALGADGKIPLGNTVLDSTFATVEGDISAQVQLDAQGQRRVISITDKDGNVSGRYAGGAVSAEVEAARGTRPSLAARLSVGIMPSGAIPIGHIYGAAYLRETRQRLMKLEMGDTDAGALFTVALIGDSFTQASPRYAGPLIQRLRSRYGNAGAGWVSFSWSGSSIGSSALGNIVDTDVPLRFFGSLSKHINDSESPDSADLRMSVDGCAIEVDVPAGQTRARLAYRGTGGVAASVRYRWGADAWTVIDMSTTTGPTWVDFPPPPVGGGTLRYEWVSGSTVTYGMELRNASPGVRAGTSWA
ncbi:hypothetical protein [Pseudoroseomonas cervicalis]|uniref:hypothetical protein n=1 Tax=Teichococcus cervicalis TaxID=204525 RepID=UPI002783B92B|nr:hypothetical protein [Pseudoroseomonas cervicalis]MDQ1078015.1 hypothetical protein [Pseudoroseomonas cervicalis]